jgi:uncharacterized protein YbcI
MTETEPRDRGNQRAAAISRAMTTLHRERYGRGPNTVRTVIGHDHVICFLEDVYTPGERTLIDAGELEPVMEMRRAFQRAMKEPFTDAIEEIMGRTVRAFLSQTHIEPDISCEIFVLEPDGDQTAPEGVG